MPEPAHAQDGDEVARERARVPQGVERRDAGAHERRGLGRGQPVGDPGERARRHRDVVLVAAVMGDPRNPGAEAAEEEVAPAAGIAVTAMPAMPADPDAIADVPAEDIGADGVHDACDLMAGHTRVLDSGPEPILRQRVAVADPAGLDPHAHETGAGHRNLALDHLEGPSRPRDLNRAHLRHDSSIGTPGASSARPCPRPAN